MRKRIKRIVKRMVIIMASILVFLCLCRILLVRHTFPLLQNGRVAYEVKRVAHWSGLGETHYDVYVHRTKLFGLWGDSSHGPLFLYPFGDDKRFLCVDDDDMMLLVFIVDFSSSATDTPMAQGWPSDVYVRDGLARGGNE